MRRRSCSSALSFAAIPFFVACGETSVITIAGLECDDIVVAAIVEDDEVVGAVKGLGCEQLRLSGPGEGQVVAWVLEREAVIEADGREATNVFDRLRVSTSRSKADERDGAGACERCTSAIDGNWTIAQPGDHCAPSRGLPATIFDLDTGAVVPEPESGWLENVRANTRISWTGDCACQPSPSLPAKEIEACALLPEAQPWSLGHYSAALGTGGWAGLFGRTHAQVVDPQGTTWDSDYRTELQSGEIMGVAALVAGDSARFVVAARARAKSEALLPVDLFLAGPQGLERRPNNLEGPPEAWIQSVRALSSTSFLLAGSDKRPGFGGEAFRDGFLKVYTLPADAEVPRLEQSYTLTRSDAMGLLEAGVRDGVITAAGTLVAMTTRGEFVFRNGQNWTRVEGRETPDGLAFGFARMATIGRTVYACRQGAAAPSGIVRFELNEDETDASAVAELTSLGTQCTWIERTSDGSAVRVVFPPNRIVDLDEDGVIHEGRIERLPGFESLSEVPGFHAYLSASDGSEALFGNNFSTLFGRRPSGPVTRLLGREDLAFSRVRIAEGMAPRSQVAFRMGQSPTIVELDPSSLCSLGSIRTVPIEGYPIAARPEAALHLGESRYLVLTSTTSSLTAYWVDLEGARIEHQQSWPSVPPDDQYHLALLSSRWAILLAERSGFFALSNPLEPSPRSEPEALELDFDDPAEPGRVSAVAPTEWRSLSVSHGLGWASGRDALARIVPTSEGVRVEAYWMSRTRATPFELAVPRHSSERPVITSVDAECPDRVTVSVLEPWRGSMSAPDIYPMMWQILPSGERAPSCLGTIDPSLQPEAHDPSLLHSELDLCGVDAFGGVNHSAQSQGDILSAFSTPHGVRLLFESGSLQAGASYSLPSRMDRGRYDRAEGLLWYSRQHSDGIGVISVP